MRTQVAPNRYGTRGCAAPRPRPCRALWKLSQNVGGIREEGCLIGGWELFVFCVRVSLLAGYTYLARFVTSARRFYSRCEYVTQEPVDHDFWRSLGLIRWYSEL
jgi:hypothetical protein